MGANVTVADILNVFLVIIGVASLVVPMHLQNRRELRKQLKMGKKAWRAIRRHEIKCDVREKTWNDRWLATSKKD